jgi:hypothetical protein
MQTITIYWDMTGELKGAFLEFPYNKSIIESLKSSFPNSMTWNYPVEKMWMFNGSDASTDDIINYMEQQDRYYNMNVKEADFTDLPDYDNLKELIKQCL